MFLWYMNTKWPTKLYTNLVFLLLGLLICNFTRQSGVLEEKPSNYLPNVSEITFSSEERTKGWGTPELSQLQCIGDICPSTPTEFKCSNKESNENSSVVWLCEAKMRSLFDQMSYRLKESAIVCQQHLRGKGHVVDRTCLLVYMLESRLSSLIRCAMICVSICYVLYLFCRLATNDKELQLQEEMEQSSTKKPSQEASPSLSDSIIDEASASTPANETSCPSIPDSANDKSTSTLDDNRRTPQKLTAKEIHKANQWLAGLGLLFLCFLLVFQITHDVYRMGRPDPPVITTKTLLI